MPPPFQCFNPQGRSLAGYEAQIVGTFDWFQGDFTANKSYKTTCCLNLQIQDFIPAFNLSFPIGSPWRIGLGPINPPQEGCNFGTSVPYLPQPTALRARIRKLTALPASQTKGSAEKFNCQIRPHQ